MKSLKTLLFVVLSFLVLTGANHNSVITEVDGYNNSQIITDADMENVSTGENFESQILFVGHEPSVIDEKVIKILSSQNSLGYGYQN